MSNHPNRKPYDLKTPTPAKVASARAAAGLSQAQAAAVVHVTTDAWSRWESDAANVRHRPMPLMAWELFQRKTRGMERPMTPEEAQGWRQGSDRVRPR